jgi:hypothetical protein
MYNLHKGPHKKEDLTHRSLAFVGKTPHKRFTNAIKSSSLSTAEPEINLAAVEHSRGD